MAFNKNTKVPSTCPKIKDIDTRCGRGCIKNYTMFNQKVPVYLFCKCNNSHFFRE